MDGETQQSILEKLIQYGDSVLEEDSPPHQTSKRRKAEHHHGNTVDDAIPKKKMKKKKKKKAIESVNASNEKYSKEKQNSLKDFEEELRLFQASQKEMNSEKEANTVLDRRKDNDVGRTKKRKAPEVIVFDDPTKRKKGHTKPESRLGLKGRELDQGEVDLDQARHEVWKFGISGMSFDDKEKQEAAKAIQLGAKPPKRAFVNYKELMETKRQKKIEEKQQREIERQMGLKTSKKKEGKIQLQNMGFWTDKTQRKGVYVDGQLGKYKRGVQVFSKRDLANIKNQRGKSKR